MGATPDGADAFPSDPDGGNATSPQANMPVQSKTMMMSATLEVLNVLQWCELGLYLCDNNCRAGTEVSVKISEAEEEK